MDAYRRPRRRLMADINVVPYIDVMLVLLVIFMITAPLLSAGVKVELPQAAARPDLSDAPDTLVVTVDQDGKYYLDDKPIGADALEARIATVLRVNPAVPVQVRGDRRVAYGEVVRLMVLLQRAGAAGVGLVTDPPPRSGAGGR